MKFEKYDNIKRFIDDNLKIIEEKEWLNNLMVGNCVDGLKNGTKGWLLARITNDSKTELIILNRKPWHLLFYSPTNNRNDELYEFAAKEIYKIDKEILGVNGDKELARKFAKYYCKEANMKYEVQTEMRILLLEKIIKAKMNDELIFRKAKLADKPTLIKYLKDFRKEALNEKITDEEIEKNFKEYMERGYYVLENKGKIVSQAALLRDIKKGKCVSAVYTPREERNNGYAYNLVYRISEEAFNNGAEYCVLYTDDTNPISNHVYEKIGYERKIDCEDLRFINLKE